jgi:dTMP kinase
VSGVFITFEGGEGVGKTTSISFFAELLRAAQLQVVVTREPGGTQLGEAIREILLQPRTEPVAAMTELLLMFSARAQHLQEVIRPALGRGQWVLCDRFTDASFAYQGGGRGIEPAVIESLESIVQGSIYPDVTILLDADVATGMGRARGRGELDRIEQETLAFFERVRESYLQRAQAYPARFKRIDASQPLQQVQNHLQHIAQELIDGARDPG